jgi:IS1 family transposase
MQIKIHTKSGLDTTRPLWYKYCMNKFAHDKRVRVVNCLIEGCSIRATVRMTGVAKKTVMRFLVEVGEVCADYQDRVFRNLSCRRIQLDELWGFNYCKQKNVTTEIESKIAGAGDVWLWVATDAETKLVPAWKLGDRDAATATEFVADLAARLNTRIQPTSDGHRVYLKAVENAFGSEVDYAMLVKMYVNDRATEARYSPAECVGCKEIRVIGRPEPKHISTSFVERQNWSVRTEMRRSLACQMDSRARLRITRLPWP